MEKGNSVRMPQELCDSKNDLDWSSHPGIPLPENDFWIFLVAPIETMEVPRS